jgi:Rrf2 family protein
MLTIGRHTDYAARVVLHLASLKPGARVTAKSIAEKRLIPRAFVRRIVSRLSAAGILRTTRGQGGGITLARPSSKISLLDVVEAMEGPVVLNGCVTRPGDCPLSDVCPVRTCWTGVNARLSADLGKQRFSRLAAKLKAREAAQG